MINNTFKFIHRIESSAKYFILYSASFLLLAACLPFGKSFFKNEHLSFTIDENVEINLMEDQNFSGLDFEARNFVKDTDCSIVLSIQSEASTFIDPNSVKISGSVPYCKLEFKLLPNTYGESNMTLQNTDPSEGSFRLKVRIKVDRLLEDTIFENILNFENQAPYTLNPSDGIEWNQSSPTDKHIRIRQIDLKDDAFIASTTDQNFSNYVSKDEIITLDTSSNIMRLTTSNTSSYYDSNFAELSSEWTPHWNSIVHYWKMNEENGSMSARDSVGSATATTASASVFNHSDGLLGKAASFNASTLNNSVAFSNSNNFTISLWAYVRSLPVEAHFWDTGGSGLNGWGVRISGGCGTPGYSLNVLLGGITCALFTSTPDVSTSRWIHYAVRRESNNMWSFFVNGYPIYNNPSTAMNSPSAAMRFGSGLNGLVDEVALWNVALGWSEITTIYNRQAAKFGGSFVSRIIDIKEITKPITEINISSSFPVNKDLSYNAVENSNVPSGFGYYESISNFAQSLVSYFRFDSVPAVITNGQTITAHVGPNATAINGNGYMAYMPGRASGFVLFDGSDDSFYTNNSINPTSGSFTISFWQKSFPNGTSFWSFVSNRNSGAGNSGFWITQRTDGAPHVGKLRVQLNTTTLVNNFNVGTVNVSNGEWRHVVVVVDRSTNRMHFYVDGQVDVSDIDISAVGNIASTVGVYVGRDPSTGNMFAGSLDDFAMWHRALSRQEVAELYRRGANRSFYQIRWCEKSDCSDNPSFVGIDGTASSYLSEVVNTHNYTDTGIVNSTALSFVFSQLGSFFSGFQTWLSQASTKKYFQYRVFMDTLSDSTSTLCDTSNAHYGMSRFTSGSQPCMPDVKAVGFGPDRVYQDYVILNSNFEKDSAKDFGSYEKFEVEYTSASCQAELGFQLRPVGVSAWYYYSGEKWSKALTNDQKNTASVVSSNISKFSDEVSAGRLDVRTIFKSGDGSKNCEIKQITISGKG